MSLPMVAQQLDISPRSVYRLIASGELPRPVKVGGSSKLFEHQVLQYMESLEQNQRKYPVGYR